MLCTWVSMYYLIYIELLIISKFVKNSIVNNILLKIKQLHAVNVII